MDYMPSNFIFPFVFISYTINCKRLNFSANQDFSFVGKISQIGTGLEWNFSWLSLGYDNLDYRFWRKKL